MIIPKAAVTALAAQSKRPAKKASIDDDSNDDSDDDWLDTKKSPAKKKKTASRKPSMKEIASRKRSHKEIFDDNILKLKEFKVIHGHVKVIPSYDVALYVWCKRKRKSKSKLTDWQSAALDDIDFFVQKKPTGKLDKCMNRLYINQSNKI